MNETEFWASRWRDLDTPWDMGRPHPNLESLWNAAKDHAPERARVYIPACGRAHEGAWFASKGHEVVAEDIVPEAIGEARKLYGAIAGLELRVGDLFEVRPEDREAFDVVFDRAAFCAFPPSEWERYTDAAAARLKRGGLFLSLPFVKSADPPPQGPPFYIPKEEWRKLASKKFSVIFLEERDVERPGSGLRRELLAVASRT
jgi:hypothetical protein